MKKLIFIMTFILSIVAIESKAQSVTIESWDNVLYYGITNPISAPMEYGMPDTYQWVIMSGSLEVAFERPEMIMVKPTNTGDWHIRFIGRYGNLTVSKYYYGSVMVVKSTVETHLTNVDMEEN